MRIKDLRDFTAKIQDGIQKHWFSMVRRQVLQRKIIKLEIPDFFIDYSVLFSPDDSKVRNNVESIKDSNSLFGRCVMVGILPDKRCGSQAN
jgi:hypothetical protein